MSSERASEETSVNSADDLPDFDESEEKLMFQRVVNTFGAYRVNCFQKLARTSNAYKCLSDKQKALIPHFKYHLKKVHACISHNYHVLELITADLKDMFQNACYQASDADGDTTADREKTHPRRADHEKLESVLRHFTRDWSQFGAIERDASYGRCVAALERLYPNVSTRSQVKVLVPGAGLGRLSFEIVKRNFETQGNEFSYFMLICSNFILNKCDVVDEHTIFPYVSQHSNVIQDEDQCLPVAFPDVNPRDLPKNCKYSMTAGDFREVYCQQSGMWDCVTTSFFIDTAHNVIEYVERIYDIIKPGGYWVNFGPLLYHFEDISGESSLELSYQQLKDVIQNVGFQYLEEEADCETPYAQNPKTMLQYRYKCVFFVCTKP